MKNISEKNLKAILIGIVIVALLVLTLFSLVLTLSLVIWYVIVLSSKRDGKCRLYRWIVAGILFHPFMSGWGVWRATGNILTGLIAIVIIFSGRMIIRYFRDIKLFNLNEIYYSVFELAFALILTFIILRWAWRRLPDEMKVYGWT